MDWKTHQSYKDTANVIIVFKTISDWSGIIGDINRLLQFYWRYFPIKIVKKNIFNLNRGLKNNISIKL